MNHDTKDTIDAIRVLGPRPCAQWALDVLVDASDYSVGMYGCEPREHSDYYSLGEALAGLAGALVEQRAHDSLAAAADEAQSRELEAYEAQLAAQPVAP